MTTVCDIRHARNVSEKKVSEAPRKNPVRSYCSSWKLSHKLLEKYRADICVLTNVLIRLSVYLLLAYLVG